MNATKMVKLSELSDEQKKIRDSVNNGWYMSGTYRAILGKDMKEFEADSTGMLTKDVTSWFRAHDDERNNMRLLVKCVDVH